jgi:acetyl/propionyl-CoA carboxylase alpha subunit
VVVGDAGDVLAHYGRQSGEPALRLIRAVQELNEERGFGIRVIAFHTEAERQALFVRAADNAARLRDVDSTGSSTRCSQFPSTRLLSALDALAVHPHAAIKVAEFN